MQDPAWPGRTAELHARCLAKPGGRTGAEHPSLRSWQSSACKPSEHRTALASASHGAGEPQNTAMIWGY
eukprot:3936942-Rhodomonas_salina.2